MEPVAHISQANLQRFRARVLPVPEMTGLARHLSQCVACRQNYQNIFQGSRKPANLSAAWQPAEAARHEHPVYEQLVGYYDEALPADERALLEAHFTVCSRCHNELDYYAELRRHLAEEMATVYAPVEPPAMLKVKVRDIWRGGFAGLTTFGFPGKAQTYAFSLAALFLMAGVLGVFLWRERSGAVASNRNGVVAVDGGEHPGAGALPPSSPDFPANPKPTPAPSVSQGTPKATPSQLKPLATPAHSPASPKQARLTGQGSELPARSRSGGVITGAKLPVSGSAAPELLARNLPRPAVLDEIAGVGSTVRNGSEGASLSTLVSPVRLVVSETRPAFRWKPLAGATGYRVVVADANHRAVAQSGMLPANATAWTPVAPLPRGQVLTWAVVALVNGEEVIMPGPGAPEAKFKVLTDAQRQRIARLHKQTRPSLALGVFYAQTGLLAEAVAELEEYLKLHPNNSPAQNLLQRVKAWR